MFSLAARMGRMQTKSGKVWYFTKRQNTFPDFFVRASPTFCEVGKIWFASLKDRDASSMKQNSIGALTGPELCIIKISTRATIILINIIKHSFI